MGKILIIKNTDFSNVAVQKVTIIDDNKLSLINQFILDTIEYRGGAANDFEYIGYKYRISTDVFTPEEIGMNEGDTIFYTLPKNIIFGNRNGGNPNNLYNNDYWYYNDIDNINYTSLSKTQGELESEPIQKKNLGNVQLTLNKYNCLIFSLAINKPTPEGINIDELKQLISNGSIAFYKV